MADDGPSSTVFPFPSADELAMLATIDGVTSLTAADVALPDFT